MRTKFVTRRPDWLGSRTINCYISLSEVAGQIVKGKFQPNEKAKNGSNEFSSKVAELIHEYGGVVTIIDSYSVVVYLKMTENVSESHERALRFSIELKKLVNDRASRSLGRRKVAIVISSEEEIGSFLELSKSCLIKSYELILNQKAYEQVQKSVKAIRIGSMRPNSKSGRETPLYLFQDTVSELDG